MFNSTEVETAYRKLKRYVYYDKTDLYLRLSLARFESDGVLKDKLDWIQTLLSCDDLSTDSRFHALLSRIKVKVMPKKVRQHSPNEGEQATYLTNVNYEKTHRIEKINYFIDAPIELHIIAVLWIMRQGWILDRGLAKVCVGNRLEESVGNLADQSGLLLRPYHKQYAKWRDNGISEARELLSSKESVCIIGLDLKEYYYHIRFDLEEMRQYVSSEWAKDPNEAKQVPISVEADQLLKCLSAIYGVFRERCSNLLRITHSHLESNGGIAIGICSSPLIGNWYLKDFDQDVLARINPAYYARYVDDIMMVVASPSAPGKKGERVASFIRSHFVETGIMRDLNDKTYQIVKPAGLELQRSKCILQFFDKSYSTAVLEKFKKKLEANASDFLLLPVEEDETILDDVAYDLLYEGSVNKFRSVKGMVENRYELGKQLDRQTTLCVLTGGHLAKDARMKVVQFFKGSNSIEFYGMWERVFTFFVVSGDEIGAERFFKRMEKAIKRAIYHRGVDITLALREHLQRHLELSRQMALALRSSNVDTIEDPNGQQSLAFRNSNLIRYQYLQTPLLNYTTYTGSYLETPRTFGIEMDARKLKYSPRYVYLHELMVLANSEIIAITQVPLEWANDQYRAINGKEPEAISWTLTE